MQSPHSPLTASGSELAVLMLDLGYSCCANAKSLSEVLAQMCTRLVTRNHAMAMNGVAPIAPLIVVIVTK